MTSAETFLRKINNIIVPDNVNFEIEARILVDNSKKYDIPYKSFSKSQTIDIAKKLINKYKDKNCSVNQTINFLKNEYVKQLLFVRGEQKKDKQIHYKKKSLIHPIFMVHDFYPAYRLAFTFEVPINEFSIKEATNARIRLRYSIEINEHWQLDITLVKNIIDLSNTNIIKTEKNNMLFDIDTANFTEKAPWFTADHVEFELEYIGDHTTFEITHLLVVDKIFDGILESPSEGNISNDYQKAIYGIAKYIKPKISDRFKSSDGLKQLSNQVIELNKSMYLREVAKDISKYYITDKLDGKRSVIMLSENVCIAVTDVVTKLNLESKNTYIFDTEFYDDKYYIFDIMVWQDEVITAHPFEKRLSYFEQAEKMSDLFRLKPFVRLTDDYKSQLKLFKKQKKPYDIDGIILTPYDGNYNTMRVYKYKPVEKMSIDFLIKKCPDRLLGIAPYLQKDNNLYLLFCGITSVMYNKLGMRFVKHYGDIFNTMDTFHLPKYFPIQFQPSNKTYAYLFWDKRNDLDGQVGEFVYNINDETWNLHKIREDRKVELARGNYYGNNYKIAENIWMSYSDPLVIEELSEEESYFQEHDNQIQKSSRNFNSFVKSKIFEQFKDTNWIIDLASGKGQDLFRYGKYGMKNVVFLEIDNNALSELLARKYDFADSTDKTRMNIMLHQVDLNEDHKSNIEKMEDLHIPNTGVDLIVCNFAFHYFIHSKKQLINIIKFINFYLKPGGRFVFTAFDGKEIVRLLNENNGDWTIKKGVDIKYSIKKQYKLNVLEPIGQEIDVLLPFSNDQYYSEYLVNIDYISDEFSTYNMILETDQSFRDYLDEYKMSSGKNYEFMDASDKKYVGLYHYYCFYKKNQIEKTTSGSSAKNRKYKK